MPCADTPDHHNPAVLKGPRVVPKSDAAGRNKEVCKLQASVHKAKERNWMLKDRLDYPKEHLAIQEFSSLQFSRSARGTSQSSVSSATYGLFLPTVPHNKLAHGRELLWFGEVL